MYSMISITFLSEKHDWLPVWLHWWVQYVSMSISSLEVEAQIVSVWDSPYTGSVCKAFSSCWRAEGGGDAELQDVSIRAPGSSEEVHFRLLMDSISKVVSWHLLHRGKKQKMYELKALTPSLQLFPSCHHFIQFEKRHQYTGQLFLVLKEWKCKTSTEPSHTSHWKWRNQSICWLKYSDIQLML